MQRANACVCVRPLFRRTRVKLKPFVVLCPTLLVRFHFRACSRVSTLALCLCLRIMYGVCVCLYAVVRRIALHYTRDRELPLAPMELKFMAGLMDHPQFVRHLVVAGNLHHGKTSLIDLFVKQSHARPGAQKKSTDETTFSV